MLRRPTLRRPQRAASALVALVAILLAACGGDGPIDIDPPTEPDPTPASVELDTDRLVLADGSEGAVHATVRDEEGRAMESLPSGVSLVWRVDDEAVATVDGDGLVRAVSPGETQLHARVGDLEASAEVVVTQVPSEAAAESGSGQETAAGEAFEEPLVMRVTDRHGDGVEGVTVRFLVEAGEVDPAEARTDAEGRAHAVWTPEPKAGEVAAGAEVPALETDAAFTGRVRAASPASLILAGGDDQQGTVAEALPDPVRVQVRDRFDNLVPGAGVSWSASVGGGSVSEETTQTDSTGAAAVVWTLGTVAGDQRLEVEVDGAESVTAGALATAGAAARLRLVSGDEQAGVVGDLLADPLVVEVTDAYGNPVEGAEVVWSADAEGDLDATGKTDAAGRAQARWTLGAGAGEQAASAQVGDLDPVRFGASARAAAAAHVERVSGEGQEGEVGTALGEALVIRVLDAHANPVPDAEVTWAAEAGSLADIEVRTDAEGLARARWTLGTAAGAQSASAGAGDAEVTFGATARPGSVAKLETVSGTGQGGEVGAELADPLTVRATDRFGNTVAGAALSWSPGAGTAEGADDATDTEGEGSARWTLGTTAGSQTMTASSGGASAAFEATARPGAVAEVRTDPASVFLEERWQERTLTAAAYDRYGNAVPDAALVWTIDHAEVAALSEAGRLRAERRGTTTARATSDGVTGTVAVEIAIPTSEASVGSTGGEVTTDDGDAALDLPPSALSIETTVSVSRTSTETLPSAERVVEGTVYSFEPSGIQFEEPVQLRVRYDPSRIPAGVDERHLRLHRLTDAGWRPVEGGSVDLETRTVSASLTSFSVYGVQPDSRLEEDALIQLHLEAEVPYDHVTRLRATVTASDLEDDIHAQLSLRDGRATATVDVAPGNGRTITVRAFDAAGVQTHRGSTTEDFPAGQDGEASVTLDGLQGDQPIEVRVGTRLLRIDPGAATLRTGQTIRLAAYLDTATGEVKDPAGTTWGSANPAIATVAADGTVTARYPGSVRIVANYEGVAAEAVLTVTD